MANIDKKTAKKIGIKFERVKGKGRAPERAKTKK